MLSHDNVIWSSRITIYIFFLNNAQFFYGSAPCLFTKLTNLLLLNCYIFFTGAMLSHDNVTWSSRMAIEHYNWNQERLLSYLPLSHVAACLIDCYMSMYAATEIHFADQEALKGTLVCIF